MAAEPVNMEKKEKNFCISMENSGDGLSKDEMESCVCRLLETLGISWQMMHHAPVRTSADCTEIERELHTSGCKNLFLRGSSGTAWYLVLLPPEEKADLRALAVQLGEKRLSFAGKEDVKNILHTEPGAVSILCLCFETAEQVRVLIHRKILEKETIGCHPCINTASLKLSVRDLTEKFLEPAPVQISDAMFIEYRRRPDAVEPGLYISCTDPMKGMNTQ